VAGIDWTTLVVALAGVAGTIGGAWLGQRAPRWQAREQTEREQRAKAERHRERASRERQQLCIELNSAARVYRLALLYAARSSALGGRITGNPRADVEQARSAYGTHYARAQMMVPKRILRVATEVTRCLAVGHQLLTRVDLAGDQRQVAQSALDWARDTTTEATAPLRRALREDLAVDPPIRDLDEQIATFASLRAVYETEPDAVCPPKGTGRSIAERGTTTAPDGAWSDDTAAEAKPPRRGEPRSSWAAFRFLGT
jgi:hypothetical protein